MFFNKKKIKEIWVITPFDDKQTSFISQNPNNNGQSSQIISTLGVLIDGEIQKNDMSFWLDNKMVNNIKPTTIYKVSYKPFDNSDIRSKYPNSFILIKLKECKLDNSTKSLFDSFVIKEKQQLEEWQQMSEKAIALEREKELKAKARLIPPPIPGLLTSCQYNNTPFHIEIDWDCFEAEDEDDAIVERKAIQKFLKSKNELIELALNTAVKNELELAKEWTETDNLTKEQFIKNLLTEPFSVMITGKNTYEIVFETNNMFFDNSLICTIEKGKCINTTIEG